MILEETNQRWSDVKGPAILQRFCSHLKAVFHINSSSGSVCVLIYSSDSPDSKKTGDTSWNVNKKSTAISGSIDLQLNAGPTFNVQTI